MRGTFHCRWSNDLRLHPTHPLHNLARTIHEGINVEALKLLFCFLFQ
jgi:hypothetical protein